jgi:AI-2 transport protein TqsA
VPLLLANRFGYVKEPPRFHQGNREKVVTGVNLKSTAQKKKRVTTIDPPALRPIVNVYILPAVVAGILAVAMVFHFLSDAFLPFITALLLANIFTPMVEFFRKRRVPMALNILLVLVMIGGFLFLVGLFLNTTFASILEVMPKYQQKWDDVLLPKISSVLRNIVPEMRHGAAGYKLSSGINPAQLSTALFSVTSFLSGFALILLFVVFILASNGQLRKKMAKAFPISGSVTLGEIVDNIDHNVRKYLLTTLVANALAGAVMWLELWLFGVDLALMWSVLTFLLMFIPSLGAIFAIAITIAVAFVQFDSQAKPLVLSLIIIVSQLVMGSVLLPRILGKTLNLSPLLLLVSSIFWGWVWGLMGMILAVPITSSLAIIFENIPALRPLAILMSSEPSGIKLLPRALARAKRVAENTL